MAKCNRKTLRGIFGIGRKLGFDIDDLRTMTKNGYHLSEIEEPEAARLLHNLRTQQAGNRKNDCLWRLYSSSTLAREINLYVSMIDWKRPGGFRIWLKKYFGVERLEWIASFQTAVNVKNALKRMYHQEQKSNAR